MNHMEQARAHRSAVLDLLARFPAMSRSHVADVLFAGKARAANRVLLSLTRARRIHRFPLMPHGEFIYGLNKRPAAHLEHHLAIAGLFAALVRGAPFGSVTAGAANVELQKGLITDLLAIVADTVVLAEVHLGTNAFGSKLDRYQDYRAGGKWEQAPWWEPGIKVVVWLVAPPAAVPRLERLATPHRVAGMRVVVSGLPGALSDPRGCLDWLPAPDPVGARFATAKPIRWTLPRLGARTVPHSRP